MVNDNTKLTAYISRMKITPFRGVVFCSTLAENRLSFLRVRMWLTASKKSDYLF